MKKLEKFEVIKFGDKRFMIMTDEEGKPYFTETETYYHGIKVSELKKHIEFLEKELSKDELHQAVVSLAKLGLETQMEEMEKEYND